ncbi:hypothetical protein D9M68_396640 [compost metagenome]
MGADRGVDAHVLAVLLEHGVVQRVAHAVQALEFELAVACHAEDAGHGVRVVAGELRVDDAAGEVRQQVARAGQVGGVGAFLAGEHRVAVQAPLLALLDLTVPVGALDQAQRHLGAELLAQQGQPHQHRQAALGVGLHHQAELAPAGDGRVAHQLLVELQRQLQAIGFLGVDGDADVQLAGADRQLADVGKQLGEHALALRHFIARVQCGELDGDRRARAGADLRLGADGVDGLAVVGHVLLGIVGGQRRLAEHVERVGVALLALRTTVLQRLADGAAEHELLAHQLHGLVHRGADHRLAGALDQLAEHVFRAAIGGFRVDHLAGHHQAPGGEVDQHVVALAEVALPLGGAQLIADQRVGGGGVRHAQQGLGEAHQHQPFLGVEAVLAKKGVEGIDGIVPAAHLFDQGAGVAADGLDALFTRVGELQELLEIGGFVNVVVGADLREEIGRLLGRDPGKELVLQDVTGFEHHAHPLVESVCYGSSAAIADQPITVWPNGNSHARGWRNLEAAGCRLLAGSSGVFVESYGRRNERMPGVSPGPARDRAARGLRNSGAPLP